MSELTPTLPSRKLQTLLHAASILLLLGVSVACAPERSGGSGDDCASDDDCLRSEVCIFDAADDEEGECKETTAANNSNNSSNNSNNSSNNSTNNSNNSTNNSNNGSNNSTNNSNNGSNNSTNNSNNGSNNSNNGSNNSNNGSNNSNNGTNNSNNGSNNSNNGTNNSNNGSNNSNNGTTPGTPSDYSGYEERASYIYAMSIELEGAAGDDVDGDGRPDNAMGNLFSNLNSLLGGTDVNLLIQESIESGALSLGMTWPGVGDLSTATMTDLDFFRLYPDPSGEPTLWLADPNSFIPGSSTPEIRFRRGRLNRGALDAGPSTFNLPLPLSEQITLDLQIERARLKGFASADNPGIALTDGTLSGAVPLASLYAAINTYIDSPSCSCVDGGTPLINIGSGESYSCNALDSSACQGDQEVCGTLVGACSLLTAIVGGEADIDLDNDRIYDALSVFLRLEAYGAWITGPAAD